MQIGKSKFYEQINLQLNIKIKKYLGWEPTYNIKKSIQITADWYKEVLVLKKKPFETTSYQIDEYV